MIEKEQKKREQLKISGAYRSKPYTNQNKKLWLNNKNKKLWHPALSTIVIQTSTHGKLPK